MNFFVCMFCGKRAGYDPGEGALHEEPTCEAYKRLDAEAFGSKHERSAAIANPFKGERVHVIEIDNPAEHLEDEN